MGIAGLLAALRPISRTRRLEEFQGAKIGVCGHAWLHALATVYAHEVLFEHKTESVVRAFLRRCGWLRDLGITVIVSLDGQQFPGKATTAQARAEKRAAAEAELRKVK